MGGRVKIQQRLLCKSLEAEMVNGSALMEAKELFDHECPSYVRGFLEGYYHCLKLGDKLDAISEEELPET
jgi:hypothetical protein